MYPIDFHTGGRQFRTSRTRGDHDEREWLAFRTREIRRDRRGLFRRFVHVLGLCFR
jgi:hypothetical protein